MRLNAPEVPDQNVMQQWFQIVNHEATVELSESDCEDKNDYAAGNCSYYESMACNILYNEKALDENSGVSIANVIVQGYKGTTE